MKIFNFHTDPASAALRRVTKRHLNINDRWKFFNYPSHIKPGLHACTKIMRMGNFRQKTKRLLHGIFQFLLRSIWRQPNLGLGTLNLELYRYPPARCRPNFLPAFNRMTAICGETQ